MSGSCRWGRWGWALGVSAASSECGETAGCPRHCSRWVVGWAWWRQSAGSSLQHQTSRLPEAFLCPNLKGQKKKDFTPSLWKYNFKISCFAKLETHHVLEVGLPLWKVELAACPQSLRSACPSVGADPESSVPRKAGKRQRETFRFEVSFYQKRENNCAVIKLGKWKRSWETNR